MKHPALFSSKNKSKIIKVSSATILHGYLRVKIGTILEGLYILREKTEVAVASL